MEEKEKVDKNKLVLTGFITGVALSGLVVLAFFAFNKRAKIDWNYWDN